MKVLHLWIKEVFSHKAFVISNIILLLSITIFTLAFTLFRSITVSTDNVIRTLISGDYLMIADKGDSTSIENELKSAGLSYDKAIFEAALFKTKEESIPLELRIVEKSYFNTERKKLLRIKGDIDSNLYISEKYRNDGALIRENEKRATLYKNSRTFKSSFALIDDNLAFLVVDDINDYCKNNMSFMIDNNAIDKSITFDTVYKIYSDYDILLYTPESLVENFYSSLNASWSAFYFISMMFVLLSSLYAISISLSFKKDNALLLRNFEIYGYSHFKVYLYSLLSVFLTILVFINLGFALGVLLTVLFPHFASIFSSLFKIDLSYYFLSFTISIPLFDLFKVYLFEIVLSLLISSLTFLFSFRRKRAVWR